MENIISDREKEALEDHEKQELIKKYIPLVKKIASRFAMRVPPSVSLDELVSAGHLGLIDAAGKFEPDRHVNFQTYASFRIKGAILDELRNLDNYSRSLRQKSQQLEKAVAKIEKREGRTAEENEIAKELGIDIEEYHELLKDVHSIAFFSLDASIRNSYKQSQDSRTTFQDQLKGDDNPEKRLNEKELKKLIAGAVDTLSDTEKKVVTLYYFEELTLKEIGEIFERTESRICQIHSAAILKLKSKINSFRL
ncbi:MAG: FliA/WhiG family RNA polymerase sigma factor [Desulforegulaceae bacterium]|nr:FliA/WhiG family RNA polymerase sigma factor [Desulforegulaceae bacterium]